MSTQIQTTQNLRAIVENMPRKPHYYIRTFGCQQNVSDSERIAGMIQESGYEMADRPEAADLIIFNTCAVREHAEDRVFGNVGEIKRLKEANANLVVALGGCMVQQPHIANKLRESYPFVDVLFNTNELQKLPGHIASVLRERRPVVSIDCDEYSVQEGLPIAREDRFRAFVPIMYGCDNFCSYCVVPLVRGRERSRKSEDIVTEFKQIVASGYKDIMLLGQNVNSYGKGLAERINFSALLRVLNDVEGDFTIRFMTSHPKDATQELFDTIAACDKVSRHIHLPVQSGSDAILAAMHRGYTTAQYLDLIRYARGVIDGVTFSSDIIVGFPGETGEDYMSTLRLLETVRFQSLFTFIYSKREGTPAATLPDDTPHSLKAQRLNKMVSLQDDISGELLQTYIGTRKRALVTDMLPGGACVARLDDNSAITLSGNCTPHTYVWCTVTELHKKRLYGKVDNTPCKTTTELLR